jgi:hypothetical protein
MSKALLKIAGILAIVFGFINVFAYISVHFVIPYPNIIDNFNYYIILLVLVILSFMGILGGMIFLHYKDLTDGKLKEVKNIVLYWSLFFMIISPISGILGIASWINLSGIFHYNTEMSYIDELKQLDILYKKGYITEKEFKAKKKRILNI